MNDAHPWWHQHRRYFLNDTLAFINSSRSRGEAIGRCEELCKALNKIWNAFFQYRRRIGQLNATEQQNDAKRERSDTQSFRELLLHGMSDQQILALCRSKSLRRFAELTPQIMNHDTLLKEQYDPFDITDEVRKKASDEYRQLLNAFRWLSKASNDALLKQAVLKKAAQLIYVVRSNIAHSEKTPLGPDRAKSERDRVVSEATAEVIEDIFDILLDRASNRLAVYGSLAPGEANQSQLAGLDGQWYEGAVKGSIEKRDGFLEFRWIHPGSLVPVKVFSAVGLDEQFDRLDRFEGSRYQRILVPVLIGKNQSICNIYQASERQRSTDAISDPQSDE